MTTSEAPATEITKEDKIASVHKYLADQGLSLDDLAAIQTNQSEVTEEPALRPAEIAGVSNDVALDNAALTAALAALTARFNNLVAASGLEV